MRLGRYGGMVAGPVSFLCQLKSRVLLGNFSLRAGKRAGFSSETTFLSSGITEPRHNLARMVCYEN